MDTSLAARQAAWEHVWEILLAPPTDEEIEDAMAWVAAQDAEQIAA